MILRIKVRKHSLEAAILSEFRQLYDEYVQTVSSPAMALSSQALESIWRIIIEEEPASVLEYGSGISHCSSRHVCVQDGIKGLEAMILTRHGVLSRNTSWSSTDWELGPHANTPSRTFLRKRHSSFSGTTIRIRCGWTLCPPPLKT